MSWLIWGDGGKIDLSHNGKKISVLLSLALPNGDTPITTITLTRTEAKVLINALRRCYKEIVEEDLKEIGDDLK